MALRTEPAAAGRFADVEAILAPKKAGAQGCWCLTYRLPLADNDALRQPHRAEELLRLCRRRSHVPGVLAYDGERWFVDTGAAHVYLSNNATVWVG